MSVRLFGFDIEITIGFWLTALLLGGTQAFQKPVMIVVWAVVLLIGILAHELGHAFAYRAFGVRSSIRLHFLGGVTMPNMLLPLTRPKQVIVSLAGPFTGLFLTAISYVVLKLVPIAHPGLNITLYTFFVANLAWSLLNLVPVLPLDGGHVVEATLGPKRIRITLMISMVVGAGLALVSLLIFQQFIGVFIFGSAAIQAFVQLRETTSAIKVSKEVAETVRATAEPLDPATTRILRDAKLALDEDPTKAVELARGVLEGRELEGGRPQARAISEALTILGWAHIARGDNAEAADVVARLSRIARADNALVAAVAISKGDDMAARRLLEAARTQGDTRKEVFGPLIQVLLRQGEAARAAALALDCADSINAEDLRIIAGMVTDGGVHHWAGRIREVIFRRERTADDAFEAARAFARASEPGKALEFLKHAVSAGFTDTKRVYADEALVGLDELEHILPRPS